MKYQDLLIGMVNPVPQASLKKWPQGNLVQFWGENPRLYSPGAGDNLKTFLGGHVGIDIAGQEGWDVVPAHDGTVTRILGNRVDQGGLEVWVTSDPADDKSVGDARIETSYSHLDSFTVKVGDRVLKNQTGLMKIGNTGFVISGGTAYWGNAPAGKGIHLHFGLHEQVYKNGQWQPRYTNVLRNTSDPLPFLTETQANPNGDLSGLAVVLNNALAYLKFLSTKRP